MDSKEEQNIQKHLRTLIKLFLAQDILNKFSSSLDEFKSLDKAVISSLSDQMKMNSKNIHKHFNGEQKYDAIDLLRYWRAYSQIWDEYYKLDEQINKSMSEKQKLSLEYFIQLYDEYFELMEMSYIEDSNILVESFLKTFIKLIKFWEQVKKSDAQKKNPILKSHHLKAIEIFKEIPLLKNELDRQIQIKYNARLERMKD